MRGRTWIPALLAVALAASLAGCFFETRDPEKGGTEVCFESVSPNDVDVVFYNLEGSLACFQSSSYLDQLGDDFVFLPSADAQAGFPDPWDKQLEDQFLSLLFSQADSLSAVLVDQEIGRTGTQEVEVQATYRLRYVQPGGSVIVYRGEAFYTLVQRATLWILTRWQDNGGENPISLLRREIVQGGG